MTIIIALILKMLLDLFNLLLQLIFFFFFIELIIVWFNLFIFKITFYTIKKYFFVI